MSLEIFEFSQGNPIYLASTRLNHSTKATVEYGGWIIVYFMYLITIINNNNNSHHQVPSFSCKMK